MERAALAPVSNVQASSDPIPIEVLEARLLRELDGGRAGLPILPHVATAALRFANDPNSDMRKLAELVEGDPPIAARLLAVANSVIYTRTVRVTTTRGAIVRLGLSGTRDLLFQVAYANSAAGMPRYQEFVSDSFRRSVLAGLASRAISEKLRLRFEYDYLCGLLHDIGEARIYRILSSSPEPVGGVAAVHDLVARHHCRAGTELAVSWRLPEPIIEGCSHHHDDRSSASQMIRMVMMADVMVGMLDLTGQRREPGEAERQSQTAKMSAMVKQDSADADPRVLLSPPSLRPVPSGGERPLIEPTPLKVSNDEYEARIVDLESLGLKKELALAILTSLRSSAQFV